MKHIFSIVFSIFLLFTISACGSSGGGSSTTTEGTTTAETPVEEKIVGNFLFVFDTGLSIITRNIKIDTLDPNLSPEGTPIYNGSDVDNPNLKANGAWYPSIGSYMIIVTSATSGIFDIFTFTIGNDNSLTGVYTLSKGDMRHDLDPEQSSKSGL